jgi:SAM-dependent methyltransferase
MTPGHESAYDVLGEAYDRWCRSVLEDIAHYVELAVAAGGPVLEVGVGSGRIAIPTALAGVDVIGVDSSPAMLELAAAKAAAASVVVDLRLADMRALPRLGRFPLVTVPFRALLHLPTDHDRLAVLRSLFELLEPGGVLAFDVFHPDRQDIAETHGRWIEREPGISERAVWDEERGRLDLEVRTADATARMELWWIPPERWHQLLVESGFEQIEWYGWFDRRPPEPDGTDTVWIARRPG